MKKGQKNKRKIRPEKKVLTCSSSRFLLPTLGPTKFFVFDWLVGLVGWMGGWLSRWTTLLTTLFVSRLDEQDPDPYLADTECVANRQK
jgi:hypothetical protein